MASQINASNSGFGGIVSTGDSSGVLELQTTGTTAVTIDTSQRAAFVAGTAAAPAITTTGDTNTGMFFPAADTIAFAEGGAEAMRLDSAGNVGIGTASPTQKLDIRGNQYIQANSNPTNALVIAMTNQTVTSNNGCRIGFDAYNIGGASIGIPSDSASLAFYVNGNTTERMRIDSSGNVGIATSSPRNALTVNGAISGLNFARTSASNTTVFTTGTTAAYMIYATWNNGGGYAVIIAQGNISNTAVVIASSNAAGGNNAFDVTNSFASNSGNGIAIFPNGGALNLQIKQSYSGTANVFINIFGM